MNTTGVLVDIKGHGDLPVVNVTSPNLHFGNIFLMVSEWMKSLPEINPCELAQSLESFEWVVTTG